MKHQSYRNTRRSIETGDVFFTFSPAIFSRLIRLFTQSKVSHVGFFIWIGNRLFAVECIEPGILTTLLNAMLQIFGKKRKHNGCFMTPASTRFDGVEFMIGKTGHTIDKTIIVNKVFDTVGRVKYDLWGAIASIFVDTKTSRRFCSEYVADIMELQFPALDRGIQPIDIANRCGKLLLIKG